MDVPDEMIERMKGVAKEKAAGEGIRSVSRPSKG